MVGCVVVVVGGGAVVEGSVVSLGDVGGGAVVEGSVVSLGDVEVVGGCDVRSVGAVVVVVAAAGVGAVVVVEVSAASSSPPQAVAASSSPTTTPIRNALMTNSLLRPPSSFARPGEMGQCRTSFVVWVASHVRTARVGELRRQRVDRGTVGSFSEEVVE